MNDATTLKQEADDLIERMDAVETLGDDEFVAFANEFDPMVDQLKEAMAQDPRNLELKMLSSSLHASFARLSEQLSFCTLQ